MIQLKVERFQEVIRILENLEVHHSDRPNFPKRYWSPKDFYEIWKAMYDALTTQD